jgi:DNA phosphorothioation-associated putative methyltransferase
MKSALYDGLINPSVSVFDYGSGHGQDIALLTDQGIACTGWDPVFRPAAPRSPADVVNLGFVINVIEDPDERAATLRQAWQLCRRVLVVAAQVHVAGRGQSGIARLRSPPER